MQPISPQQAMQSMQQPQGQNQSQPQQSSITDALQQQVQQGNQEIAQEQANPSQNTIADVTKSLAMLSPKSNSTQIQVGKAIASPAYAGYCQQYVDDQTGSKERYPTAAATWQAKQQSGEAHQGLNGMKEGDVVEFAPDSSNGNLGHAAVVQKNGDLKMATYNGVQTFALKDWVTHTGQQPLGYYKP